MNQRNKHDETSSQANIPLIGGAGGGGLLLLLLAAVILFKVRKKKDTDKKEDEEILEDANNGSLDEVIYTEVNKQPAPSKERRIGKENRQVPIQPDQKHDAIYSKIQPQSPYSAPGNEDLYNHLGELEGPSKNAIRTPTEEEELYANATSIRPDQSQDLYSTIQTQDFHSPDYAENSEDLYAHLDRPGPQGPFNGGNRVEADESDIYAEVTFVKNKSGDDMVTYQNFAAKGEAGSSREATYATISDVIENNL